MIGVLQPLRHSLFFRLFLIFSATVIFFFIIVSLSLRLIDQNWRSERMGSIPEFYLDNIQLIVDNIGIPPDLERAAQLADELSLTIIIRSPHINWQSDDESGLDISQATPLRALSPEAEVMTVDNDDVIRVSRGGYEFFLNQTVPTLSSYDYIVMYIGLTIAVLVLFVNYWSVRQLLKPVRLLREGAEKICEGDLDYRVQSRRTDELGELTDSINQMADSLQSLLEAKRQLLLAISHELRTPVTRAKLQLEFLEDGTAREALRDDIDEIDLLISDLIEAERLSNQHSALVAEDLEFAHYIGDIMQSYRDYRGGLDVELPERDRVAHIDKLRIRLMVTNIVNNAIRHSEEAPITVSVHFDDPRQEAVLVVEDQGEGIAAEHLTHLTEPFYRADSARQRDTGGFGLGLYLCNLIAEAHGGRLTIDSELGRGTRVTIRIPLIH